MPPCVCAAHAGRACQWLASVIVGLAVAGDAILTVTLITLLLRRRTGFKQYVRTIISTIHMI